MKETRSYKTHYINVNFEFQPLYNIDPFGHLVDTTPKETNEKGTEPPYKTIKSNEYLWIHSSKVM